jgi:tRNA(Ile)-lysidine synthase
MSLAAFVRSTIRRHGLVPAGARVAVALSGGPDSVALLHLLRDLESEGDLTVAGILHYNHQLRPAAEDDERFCRDLAGDLHLPIEVGRGDVRGEARARKRSVEDMARRLRYGFFEEAARRLRADAVAVGHSEDDQAETFLLRILRGSGTRGLGGIRPKAGSIIRPLLETSRQRLREYVADRQLAFRDDETNLDLSIPRNRVRHELLPYLSREFSPGIVEVLAREASLAQVDEDHLQREAIELARTVVLTLTPIEQGPGAAADDASPAVLDADGLAAAPPAVGSRVGRLVLERLVGDRFIGSDAVQRLLDLARGARGEAVSLPGIQARRRAAGRRIELVPEPQRRGVAVEPGHNSRFALSIPGEVVLPGGLAISAGWSDPDRSESADGVSVLVSGLDGPLAVRFRRPGDRFRAPGMDGRAKKLQDYLVDRKVPREERDRLPLVVDAHDRIVWIVGHAVAEGQLAEHPSTGVILLIARHLGGEV